MDCRAPDRQDPFGNEATTAMSLLHRAKSTETGTRRPSGLVDDNHGRRMSYNPVGASNESAVEFDPPGASNVPQAWRISELDVALKGDELSRC